MDSFTGRMAEADALARANRWPEALEAYSEVAASGRSDFSFHLHYGTALLYCERHLEGRDQLLRALRLRPDSVDALNNLVCAHFQLGAHVAAEEACRHILLHQPLHDLAWSNLGLALASQGRSPEGIEALHRAIDLNPSNRVSKDNFLQVLNNIATDGAGLAEAHRALCHDYPGVPEKALPWTEGRRIRIGYVSGDFRQHSVAYFLAGIFNNHDRDAFEIFCYSANSRVDWMTSFFKEQSDHFQDITGIADADVAHRIESDGIDILVDLSGHMLDNRLSLFSLRPAPVQASYLGYPATTGCPFMDFRLVDSLTDPEGADAFATERLVRLPVPFLCYAPFPNAPEPSALPALSNGYVTFGSFNNATKLSDDTLDLWCHALDSTAGSRMFVKAACFSDALACEQLKKRFALRGIDPGRIECSGMITGMRDHLNAYGKVDIALDTFPYNGTTTTCEALWMGVPVITQVGNLHAARVGLSLLSAVGLGGLATTCAEDFAALAAAFSEDVHQLENLRRRLRTVVAHSALCDQRRFTRALEEAFRHMLRPGP